MFLRFLHLADLHDWGPAHAKNPLYALSRIEFKELLLSLKDRKAN